MLVIIKLVKFSNFIIESSAAEKQFGKLENNLKNPLYKVFNSAARLVSRTSKFSPTSPSLVLNWLPLKYKVIFKICLIMFEMKNKISPFYLTNSMGTITKLSQQCGHSSRQIHCNNVHMLYKCWRHQFNFKIIFLFCQYLNTFPGNWVFIYYLRTKYLWKYLNTLD